MSNEAIGRLSAIGLGKETVAGTAVSAGVWIPKTSGALIPQFETAQDDGGYGVIDEIYDTQTVKNTSKLSLQGIVRDNFIGYLLLGALGQLTAVTCITLGTPTGGTPARGDSVRVGNVGSETWIGRIKKILLIGATTYYFVSTTSGTLSNGNSVTNGVWTAAATTTGLTTVKGRFFERLNTNAHPTFTLYDNDPVGAMRSAYGMINNFELSCEVGDYVKFTAEFMGKKMESTSGLNPAFSDENGFLAKFANVYFATNEAGLNAATAVCVQNFRIGINKNLKDVQCFGSDDIASQHNQQFTTEGDMEALYNSITLRDYIINSDKKAMRLKLVNTSVTALATGIYPSIYLDMSKVGFTEWSKTDVNNELVNQTLGFVGQFDNTTAMQIEVLLLNNRATTY